VLSVTETWNIDDNKTTELRTIKCKDTFKRHLKTHYFKVAFLD